MTIDRYVYERALWEAGIVHIAGADEVGRGACAGPLVAAAVILPQDAAQLLPDVNDSKQLTPLRRERLAARIYNCALAVAVAEIEPAECDRLGMGAADLTGLRNALLALAVPPEHALIDGFAVSGLPYPHQAIIKGDSLSASIAAASIVAKVWRDRLMVELSESWPEYGFEKHKGYPTAQHQAALECYGPSPIHRFSYANVARTVR
ncbi:MAG: ribonuclease HII [Propionibacteriaceae bacterium]|jgi:ribonuclease HII|nr:ribonuclease HII [Propionibacteriaceae bacterium]